MKSNDVKTPRLLFRLSVALFVASLLVPVGDGWWGWQVFLAVFLRLPQALPGEPGMFMLLLSGAGANVLLIFTWVAMFWKETGSGLSKFAAWSAGAAVVLALASLLQVPFLGFGLGYWLWLCSILVAFRATLQLRTMHKLAAA